MYPARIKMAKEGLILPLEFTCKTLIQIKTIWNEKEVAS